MYRIIKLKLKEQKVRYEMISYVPVGMPYQPTVCMNCYHWFRCHFQRHNVIQYALILFSSSSNAKKYTPQIEKAFPHSRTRILCQAKSLRCGEECTAPPSEKQPNQLEHRESPQIPSKKEKERSADIKESHSSNQQPTKDVADDPLPSSLPRSSNLLEKIQEECERWLSDAEIYKNPLTLAMMSSQGWIPISVLASNRRLYRLTREKSVILEALRTSSVLEVHPKDHTLMRRVTIAALPEHEKFSKQITMTQLPQRLANQDALERLFSTSSSGSSTFSSDLQQKHRQQSGEFEDEATVQFFRFQEGGGMAIVQFLSRVSARNAVKFVRERHPECRVRLLVPDFDLEEKERENEEENQQPFDPHLAFALEKNRHSEQSKQQQQMLMETFENALRDQECTFSSSEDEAGEAERGNKPSPLQHVEDSTKSKKCPRVLQEVSNQYLRMQQQQQQLEEQERRSIIATSSPNSKLGGGLGPAVLLHIPPPLSPTRPPLAMSPSTSEVPIASEKETKQAELESEESKEKREDKKNIREDEQDNDKEPLRKSKKKIALEQTVDTKIGIETPYDLRYEFTTLENNAENKENDNEEEKIMENSKKIGKALSSVEPTKLDAIRKQCEFYFGDANILKDLFLLNLVRQNAFGWVDLHVVFRFKLLNKICSNNYDWLVLACATSNRIQISEDAQWIRRRDSLPEWDSELYLRMAIFWDLPDHISDRDQLNAVFNDDSHDDQQLEEQTPQNQAEKNKAETIKIVYSRVIPANPPSIPSFLTRLCSNYPCLGSKRVGVIEFESFSEAERAVKYFRSRCPYSRAVIPAYRARRNESVKQFRSQLNSAAATTKTIDSPPTNSPHYHHHQNHYGQQHQNHHYRQQQKNFHPQQQQNYPKCFRVLSQQNYKNRFGTATNMVAPGNSHVLRGSSYRPNWQPANYQISPLLQRPRKNTNSHEAAPTLAADAANANVTTSASSGVTANPAQSAARIETLKRGSTQNFIENDANWD